MNYLFGQQYFYEDWIKVPEVHHYKELTIWRYNLLPDSADVQLPSHQCYGFPDTVLFMFKKFDANHLPIYQRGFGGYHCGYQISTFKYDNQNRVVEQLDFSEDSSVENWFKVEFDDEKLKCAIDFLQPASTAGTMELQYSDDGVFLYSFFLNAKGVVEGWDALVAEDTLNKVFVWAWHDRDSTLQSYNTIKKNKNDLIIESSILETDSTFSQGHFYAYNTLNQIMSEKLIVSDNDGLRVINETIYEYKKKVLTKTTLWAEEQKLEEKIYQDGILKTKVTYFNGSKFAVFVYQYK